jgi:hypothetical protein
MRYLTLSAAVLAAIASLTTPAFAEGEHKIVQLIPLRDEN